MPSPFNSEIAESLPYHEELCRPITEPYSATTASAKNIVCRHYETYEELCALLPRWQEFHSQSSFPTIFSSWHWADAWWRHFKTDINGKSSRARLCIVVAEEVDGRIIGIAPFYIEQERNLPFSTRRIRLIGDGGNGEYLTEEPATLLRAGQEQEAVSSILNYLTTSEVSRLWDALYYYETSDFDSSAIQSALLKPALGRRRWEAMTWDGPEIVHLPETWIEYRKSLSKSMKDNLAYYPRKLSKHVAEWEVREVRNPSEIVDATRHLVRLHVARSKAKRGVPHENHLKGNKQAAFLEDIMATLSERGQAFISLIEADGKVIGAQCMLEYGDCLTFYYSGYDPDYYDFSPITIIEKYTIEAAIGRGIRRLDFLPYPAAWKSRWGARPERSIQYLNCSSNTIFGIGRALLRRAVNRARGFTR